MRFPITFLLLLLALVSTAADRRRLLLNRNAAAAGGGGGGGSPAVEASYSTNFINANASHTNFINIGASGANRLLLVTISFGDSSKSPAPGALTVGGTSITGSSLWDTNDATYVTSQTWYQIAPATGTSIPVIYTVSTTLDQLAIGCVVITNAHQSSPFGTVAAKATTGTAPSIAVTSAANELVYCSIASDAQTTFAVNNGTLLWSQPFLNSDTDHGGSSLAGAAPNVTPSWTTGASEASHAIAGVSIKAP